MKLKNMGQYMQNLMRIATFNANSIRNRLEIILNWLSENNCDVLCVQETKVTDDEFPEKNFLEAGYHCCFRGQKTFNGVAIISRQKPKDVEIGLGNPTFDQEARLIKAVVNGIIIVNTYIPQGTDIMSPRFQYKLEWIRNLRDYFNERFTPQMPLVWAGDFNVAREPIDVYDPEGLYGSVCYNSAEHDAFDYVKNWGFEDIFRLHHPGEAKQYTFWDYRMMAFRRKLGWRLDYIMATKPLAEKSTSCWIDVEPRKLEKPSDHTFVVAEFQIN